MFRKADIPALRQKAQTAEGQATIARTTPVLDLGGTKVTVVTLATAEHPKPVLADSASRVGQQTITLEQGHLRLASFGK